MQKKGWIKIYAKIPPPNRIGMIRGFFHGNALKIILVITDDQSDLRLNPFLEYLDRRYKDKSTFRFFGFIKKENDAHQTYQNLARELKGKTYDLNNTTGWGSLLSNFQNEIQMITKNMLQTSFTLKQEASSIDSVTVNGSSLDSSLYSYNQKTLGINEDRVEVNDQIKVTYQTK